MELLVGDVFRNAARAVPHRRAFAFGDRTLTFGQLDRAGNAMAHALRAEGVGLGDRVAVWSDSCVDLVPLFVGLAKVGAVFAPLNTRLGVDEATPVAAMTRPALLLVDPERAADGASLAARIGRAGRAAGADVGADRAGDEGGPLSLAADGPGSGGGDGGVPWRVLGDGPDGLAARARGRDDDPGDVPGLAGASPHVLFATSGSTGRPKGVVVSHRASVLRCHPGAQIEPRGTLVCPFPLFHMAAWTLSMQQWHARGGMVFTASADGAEICRAVEEHRANRAYLIPAVWRRVLDHLATPEGAACDLSSLRFADSGTSATPPELLTDLRKALPDAVLRVFYGSTEAANVLARDEADPEEKPGSCGAPSPLVQVRVADDGELLVRSPLLFDEYFDDPEATAAAFVDGWYRTGDKVEADEDGHLSITGRVNDVIRTGGEGVDPTEVEALLRTHPGVADVAVVGLPDARWGELVCAVVVPGAGAPPTVDDLRDHGAGRLAPYKLPRRVAVVDEIPRTLATHQVQRALLLERLASG